MSTCAGFDLQRGPPSQPRPLTKVPASDGLLALIAVWQQRRRARRELAAMDERQLRDIGLSSSQAARESNKPFFWG